MLTAEDIAAVKVAIEICSNVELKKEILCVPGSDYEFFKVKRIIPRPGPYDVRMENEYISRKLWNDIVEEKAKLMLEKLSLAKHLQEKVIGYVFSVGRQMLNWAKYHEKAIGFSRENCVNFLNNSFFRTQGTIDNKKAAEELIKHESLNIKQKYILACHYCFTDHILVLHKQMTKEDKKEFYDAERIHTIKQPIVKLWSYCMVKAANKLKLDQYVLDQHYHNVLKQYYQYVLDDVVKSGSKTAVEFYLERANLLKKDAIIDAALATFNCRLRSEPQAEKDWIVFRNQTYRNVQESWAPSDYYVDILCFLLSKMREDQWSGFLKTKIRNIEYKNGHLHWCCRLLEYLLDWPYQNYFMKTAGMLWGILTGSDYLILLLRISDKIESTKEHLKYGEGKSYDYRKLLKEFWCQSPEGYKWYVMNVQVFYGDETESGARLLIKLLTLNNFTLEDRDNIKLIFESANDEGKRRIFSSDEWIKLCTDLMKEEKWEILDRYIHHCFLSKEDEYKLKNFLSFTKEAQCVFIDFIRSDNWKAAESFIKWSSLAEEEINRLKKEIIYSEFGEETCVYLISPDKKLKSADQFIRWCLSFEGEDEVQAFKKKLVFSFDGIWKCCDLVANDELELVDEFINFGLSSEEEVRELKKIVAYKTGSSVCAWFVADDKSIEGVHDDTDYTKFRGCKWEEVEKFLTWCFASEEEISDFKKNKLLKVFGKKIHFKLIASNQWTEAEIFFAWLGLSDEEIKELKKETLFHYDTAKEMFIELIDSEEGDKRFASYGSKQEAIELLLRWYLIDKETVLEFKQEFKRQYTEYYNNDDDSDFEDNLENFDLLIEQHLRDLNEENVGVKRKSETFCPSKKHCSSKSKNGEVGHS